MTNNFDDGGNDLSWSAFRVPDYDGPQKLNVLSSVGRRRKKEERRRKSVRGADLSVSLSLSIRNFGRSPGK